MDIFRLTSHGNFAVSITIIKKAVIELFFQSPHQKKKKQFFWSPPPPLSAAHRNNNEFRKKGTFLIFKKIL